MPRPYIHSLTERSPSRRKRKRTTKLTTNVFRIFLKYITHNRSHIFFFIINHKHVVSLLSPAITQRLIFFPRVHLLYTTRNYVTRWHYRNNKVLFLFIFFFCTKISLSLYLISLSIHLFYYLSTRNSPYRFLFNENDHRIYHLKLALLVAHANWTNTPSQGYVWRLWQEGTKDRVSVFLAAWQKKMTRKV